MNLVRSVISVFLLVLLMLSIAGWMWAGGQPYFNMLGARFVLALCGLVSLGSLGLIWREEHPQMTKQG
jgi:hypothetical protein